jgi:hypothetical protein
MSTDFLTLGWMGLALALPIVYAAWHEYSARNMRDFKLLASIGAGGLLLSAFGFSL